MRFFVPFLLFLAGCGSSKPATPVVKEVSTEDTVARVEKSVVVLTMKGPKSQGSGSGFVIHPNGIICTNQHVIAGALSGTAKFSDGREVKVLGVLHVDAGKDLAIIKIDASDLPALKIAQELPRKGERTLAFGAPRGLDFTASDGIVSGLRDGKDSGDLSLSSVKTFIQTTAPISPGNSGGPLVNKDGDVIGVSTFIIVTGQNLNFAVSALDVQDAFEKSFTKQVRTFEAELAQNPEKEEEPEMSPRHKALLAEMLQQVATRKKELSALGNDIERMRTAVKDFYVQLDEQNEEEAKRILKAKIDAFNQLIDKPLTFTRLNTLRMKTGDIGYLPGTKVRVISVISKDSCLVALAENTYRLERLDLTDITNGSFLRVEPTLIFEVTGTVHGVFRLSLIFNSTNLVDLGVKIDDYGMVPTTVAEESARSKALAERTTQRTAEAKKLREEKEAAEAAAMLAQKKKIEAEQVAAEVAKMRDQETKAAQKLKIAKAFLGKDNKAAERRLHELVKEFPNTNASAEASELIRKLK